MFLCLAEKKNANIGSQREQKIKNVSNSRVFLMHFSKGSSRDGPPGLHSPSIPTGKFYVQGNTVLQEVEKEVVVEDSRVSLRLSHMHRDKQTHRCAYMCIRYMHIYISFSTFFNFIFLSY